MGLVSSMCKRKTRGYNDAIVHNNYIQKIISTAETSPSISSEKTECSAMSREPRNTSSIHSQYHSPTQQQQHIYSTSTKQKPKQLEFPLFSTPFYLPYQNKNNTTYRRSNPYIAQAYSHRVAPILSPLPSIHNIDHPRITRATSITDSSRITTVSDIIQTTDNNEKQIDSYRTLTRVESSITTDTNEPSSKENIDNGARLIKRSTSVPIDMFLIDISNEHVLIGQPISMNIRHLLLDTLENQHINSSSPIRIEPATITTYAHENLLNYIPYVCDRYPNVTVDADQTTRNTLHIRIPSEFSHSLNALT